MVSIFSGSATMRLYLCDAAPPLEPSSSRFSVLEPASGSSSPGEFHPQALTEPYVRLSPHTALLGPLRRWTSQRPSPCFAGEVLPQRGCLIQSASRVGLFAPCALPRFIATTSRSAPVGRIGTQSLVGLPLVTLPLRSSPDRFPRSALRPRSHSRRLHAGCRSGNKQVAPDLVPEQDINPGFDIV